MKSHAFMIVVMAALLVGGPGSSRAVAEKSGPLIVQIKNKLPGTAAVWLETSLKRVFPGSRPGATNLSLLVPRNAKASFQVCVRGQRLRAFNVECSVPGTQDVKTQVRLVGLVPLPQLTPYTEAGEREGSEFLPGLAPDPLYPVTNVTIGPDETRSFWVSLDIPADAIPGTRVLKVVLKGFDEKKQVELPVNLEISPFVVQARKRFPVIHWWRGEATWNYYKTGMFDEQWWKITRSQLENMLAHGSDVVYAPVLFDLKPVFKRPCQLLIVNETAPGKYQFDWSRVKRFTDMCRDIGFREFEWSHLWIYGGVKNPMRVYTEKNGEYVPLWDPGISGFSETYVNFLKQFLPEWHAFLIRENLLDCSYFHLSDEPGREAIPNYKRARQILRDLAPWMKVMDALSDIRYGREGLTDMPVPQLGFAKAYLDEKIPHWVYYCCSPKGPWLNRFLDTPLPKIRMSGWLFYKLQAKGFLHWGFNYWNKMESEELGDPFHDASNADYPGIPYGDPFMIYPGKDGMPLDCIRWEVFAESLQDYAILQTAGIEPDAAMLEPLQGYDKFPKNQEWIQQTLQKILRTAGHGGLRGD